MESYYKEKFPEGKIPRQVLLIEIARHIYIYRE